MLRAGRSTQDTGHSKNKKYETGRPLSRPLFFPESGIKEISIVCGNQK
jgi:hypothetical protein